MNFTGAPREQTLLPVEIGAEKRVKGLRLKFCRRVRAVWLTRDAGYQTASKLFNPGR
jgi:hypothetical protein